MVDMEEVSEESNNKPWWLFDLKEAEERQHRMVRAIGGKKKFHCMRCGMRGLYDRLRSCVTAYSG